MVMSPKAQGLVSNTHHSKTCMLKNCSLDRMSSGKGAKRTNSGSTGKKTTFSDETNHAAVSLLPKEEDSRRWVSTLAPLPPFRAASKHAARLNENRMLYNVSDATKAQIKGYHLTQIKGQTLDILWVFPSFEIFYYRNFLDTVHGRKSSHMMASSHSGFFLFYHYNRQGSCLRTVIQPLVETTGLLISWFFSFLSRTIPTSSDQQGGGLLSDHLHGHNHLYSRSTDWG